jgi:NTE family protein
MQQAPKRVNYFLQQYVDELNIKAFRNLVFEGAGVRGIAYSGAITALESLGVLKNIKRFAGTSAGAIYAIFLVLGYDAKEIRQIVASIDYRDFMDASRNFLSNSTRLLTDYGWYKGDDFIAQMQQFVANKVGDSDISFKALQAQTGNELFIIGTNLTRSCAEVYCTENTPDMPILEALRISTCIPILFKAVKRKDGSQEDILVDGGLTWNCPLELFDEEEYIYNPLNKQYLIEANTQQLYNQETLGFRLDPLKDPLVSMRTQPQAYKKIGNILEYTKEFMKFYTASSLKRHLEPENWKRVIFVDTLDIMGTDFEIESSQIESLIEQGKSGVYQHFAWRMSENGVKFPQ